MQRQIHISLRTPRRSLRPVKTASWIRCGGALSAEGPAGTTRDFGTTPISRMARSAQQGCRGPRPRRTPCFAWNTVYVWRLTRGWSGMSSGGCFCSRCLKWAAPPRFSASSLPHVSLASSSSDSRARVDRRPSSEMSEASPTYWAFSAWTSAELSTPHLLQSLISTRLQPRRATRRVGWNWSCILSEEEVCAGQREE